MGTEETLRAGVHRFAGELARQVRRGWFAYMALAVFYFLDVFLTLLVLESGRAVEVNPMNRQLISSAGPATWVVFRAATMVSATLAVIASLALAVLVLAAAKPPRSLQNIEEVAVGAVILFYALAIGHNLLVLLSVVRYV